MKKNRMMRLASVLLVCVLLTTSVISGTFAKYISTGSAEDTARVAKWGVEVTVSGDEAFFSKEYANDGAQEADSNGTITNTVVSTEKVIAPGTKGDLANFTIAGTPEVAVNVKKAATLTLTGWEVGGTYYCPLTITVDADTANETVFNGMDYANETDPVAAFKKAVEDALNADVNYAPGTDLADSHTIDWEWTFSTNEENDKKDTALGDLQTAPTITLSVEVTVEQID